MTEEPIPVVCRYRVKPGREEAFEALLRNHWTALRDAGFATDDEARLQRAQDSAGNRAYIEAFSWRSQAAVERAHESLAVMKLWEPMGALCEDMEFWNVEDIR